MTPPVRQVLPWVVLALIGGSCSAQEPPPDAGGPASVAPVASGPESGGVAYTFVREPASLDPAAVLTPGDLLVVEQIFDPLTALGSGSSVVPAAADRWDVDESVRVFTFHLRRSGRFHDGTPVTAASFKRAWERVADQRRDGASSAHRLLDLVVGIERARDGEGLEGVVAVDDHTLRVVLSAPFAEFPEVVSHPSLSPLPQVALDRPDDFDRMPIGNGPFRMAEPWQPGQFIRLEAADGHPSRPRLAQVVLRIYEGEDSVRLAYEDFERGRLDLAPVPDGSMRSAIADIGRSHDGYTGPGVLDGATSTGVFYTFNVEIEPFGDPAVRQALASLVDREALLGGAIHRSSATSIVLPGLGGYEPGPCEFCTMDPDRARELLAGRELTPIDLVYYDHPDHRGIAERYQADVNAALGEGTLTLRALPRAEWLEAIRSGEVGFFLSGWSPEYPSPGAYLQPLFHPERVGTDNLSRYHDEDVASLLGRARSADDVRVRHELYRQAEARLLEQMTVIPLFFYRHSVVVSDRIDGFFLHPMGRADLSRVSLVDGT